MEKNDMKSNVVGVYTAYFQIIETLYRKRLKSQHPNAARDYPSGGSVIVRVNC